MKYYKLTYDALNTEITGTQFQSTEVFFGDIQKNIFPSEGKINFDFVLPEPFLEKKAKPTTYLNVIMIPGRFIVLKDYFIDFLKNFNIGEYQTWKLKVHHNDKIIDDYSMFISNYPKQRELVLFNKSEFYLGKYSDSQYMGSSINIYDYEDYLIKRNKLSNENVDLFFKT